MGDSSIPGPFKLLPPTEAPGKSLLADLPPFGGCPEAG